MDRQELLRLRDAWEKLVQDPDQPRAQRQKNAVKRRQANGRDAYVEKPHAWRHLGRPRKCMAVEALAARTAAAAGVTGGWPGWLDRLAESTPLEEVIVGYETSGGQRNGVRITIEDLYDVAAASVVELDKLLASVPDNPARPSQS
jgi:hypothetical protein